jgi:hypothetical protein
VGAERVAQHRAVRTSEGTHCIAIGQRGRALNASKAAFAAVRFAASADNARPFAVAYGGQFGGELKVIAAILEAPIIKRNLAHLGPRARQRRVCSPVGRRWCTQPD